MRTTPHRALPQLGRLRAVRRAEVHQRRAPVTPTSGRHRVVSRVLQGDAAHGGADEGAGHDARDVRVDWRSIVLEREGKHGTSRVLADARQGQERGEVLRHLPAVAFDDRLRRAVQRDRASVVAESLPRAQHVGRGAAASAATSATASGTPGTCGITRATCVCCSMISLTSTA